MQITDKFYPPTLRPTLGTRRLSTSSMLREIGSPEQKVQTWAIWWYLLWHFWKA
eukprot:SAG11_NODE_39542_length_229_cov_5.484615_1_plen_53_part_01